MAGIVSVADIGGIADARTGSLTGDIGTDHDPIMHEIKAPETHGHNTIYLDSSITFEDYHWWANRSREAEKEITHDAGIKQLFNLMLGKKIREETHPPLENNGEELQDVKVDEKTA